VGPVSTLGAVHRPVKGGQVLAARTRPNAVRNRYTTGLMPYADAAPEAETVDAAASVEDEANEEPAVLLGASDPVVIV
jgi:hypothetical protein